MKYFIGFYLAFCFSTFSYAELTITQAHVRAVPPGQKASVAYMTLTNNTAQEVVISGANSPVFMSINLHRTANIEGVMTMRAQPELHIAPKQSVTLAPGGLHWMLMGLKGELKPSAEVPISLVFADGSEQKLHLVVKALVN
ncbi:MAG: copper chaperone PCu(A)C [Pseudomonadales bacterium]|nr:copper chaperone PCu(A)C [Pseudomonadales bacterium]